MRLIQQTFTFVTLFCLLDVIGEVYISPIAVNQENNLISNSNFQQIVECNSKQLGYYKSKNLQVKKGILPSDFTLISSGQNTLTKGSIGLEFLPDKKSRFLSIDTPYNKFDSSVALLSNSTFSLDNQKDPLYCGVWAKGNGTLIVKFLIEKNGKFQDYYQEKLLVVPSWHYYRVKVPETKLKKTKLKLSLSSFGKCDIAYPEISTLPNVDKSAELLFYVPFEKGSLSAKFSRGPVSSFGNDSLLPVKGMFQDAARMDRKRRFNEKGKLRYNLGFGYDFLGKALNCERGTIEFFFRPLSEMLEKQPWGNIFPLFYLGDTSWQWANAQDFSLQLELLPGNKFKLSCSENVRKKTWPNDILLPNNLNKIETAYIPDSAYVGRFQSYTVKPLGEYIINEAKSFIGKFHHLAFTYNEKGRTVWLDGKAVIQLKPLKSIAISSKIPKLLFANSHVNHPGVMSCDIDELKIYSNIKYHKQFIPSAKPPKLLEIKDCIGPLVTSKWTTLKPYLAKDKKALCFPLKRGKEEYTLEVSCADGLPLIFSPKNASFNLRTDYQIEMPKLDFSVVKIDGLTAVIANKKRDFIIKCYLVNNGKHCQLKLDIEKLPSRFRAYLEPHVTLKAAKYAWQYSFDGAEKRKIYQPFHPFDFEDMFMALPMIAAWNNLQGAALALTPETLCSWMSRSMTASNALTLKVRTVLNSKENISLTYDLFSFSPKYQEDDAVDIYSSLHPKFFKFDKQADPKTYGNSALSETWNNPTYLKRKNSFSLQELNRRTRSSWCWYYYDCSSTGNFSTDKELLQELAPVNIRHLGNWNFHDNFVAKKQTEWKMLKNMGILPGLYVSSWLDRRFQRYFSTSDFESNETYNGINYWPQYWCRNVVDHVMLVTGTEYGDALRNQMKNILQNVKSCNSLSYDLCGYNYKFRQHNSLGGLNAFDENGIFLQNVTALALLLDDIKKMKNHSQYRTSVNGNVDINLSGYPASFRQDNTIHEQQMLLTLQAEKLRRKQTRLQGERPTTFMQMPPLDGNFFGNEDPRLLRYAAIFAHHNQVLMGMLYNIRQNWEIFGLKESVQVLDELLRTQNQGYRQTIGAQITGKLELARYGNLNRGTIAVVNSFPFTQSGQLTIDKEYFNLIPFAGIEGKQILFDNGKIKIDKILPLSWNLVEFFAAIPNNQKLVYTSKLKRNFDKVELEISFLANANLKDIIISPSNNENISFEFNQKAVVKIPAQVKVNDTLKISFNNPIWKSNAQSIINYNYLKNKVITISANGKSALNSAERIVEYFRFYNVVTKSNYNVKIVPNNGTIHLEEKNNTSNQIKLQNNQVVLISTPEEMLTLTYEYLKALDTRFTWYGVFGRQQPTSPIDWAATGRQKAFQQRHKLCGKIVSVQDIVKEFQDYIKETKLDIYKGF